MPRVGAYASDVKYARRRQRDEHGACVYAAPQSVQKLFARRALFDAHEKYSDNRKHDANRPDYHRRENRLHLNNGVCHIRRRAESRSRQNRAAVGFVQVRAHASNVAHVIAHVVGDCRGVAGVVFGNARFDLSHEVGADV